MINSNNKYLETDYVNMVLANLSYTYYVIIFLYKFILIYQYEMKKYFTTAEILLDYI